MLEICIFEQRPHPSTTRPETHILGCRCVDVGVCVCVFRCMCVREELRMNKCLLNIVCRLWVYMRL